MYACCHNTFVLNVLAFVCLLFCVCYLFYVFCYNCRGVVLLVCVRLFVTCFLVFSCVCRDCCCCVFLFVVLLWLLFLDVCICCVCCVCLFGVCGCVLFVSMFVVCSYLLCVSLFVVLVLACLFPPFLLRAIVLNGCSSMSLFLSVFFLCFSCYCECVVVAFPWVYFSVFVICLR